MQRINGTHGMEVMTTINSRLNLISLLRAHMRRVMAKIRLLIIRHTLIPRTIRNRIRTVILQTLTCRCPTLTKEGHQLPNSARRTHLQMFSPRTPSIKHRITRPLLVALLAMEQTRQFDMTNVLKAVARLTSLMVAPRSNQALLTTRPLRLAVCIRCKKRADPLLTILRVIAKERMSLEAGVGSPD